MKIKSYGFHGIRMRWGALVVVLLQALAACTNSETTLLFAKQLTVGWLPNTIELNQGQQAVVRLGLTWLPEVKVGVPRFAAPTGIDVIGSSLPTCTTAGTYCDAQLEITIRASATAQTGDTLVVVTVGFEDDSGKSRSTSADLRVVVKAATSGNLSVEVQGNGRVTSNPAGLDCGAAVQPCVRSFDAGATTTLLATPDPGWRVELADGDCQVVGGVGAQRLSVVLNPNSTSRCRVRFTADRRVEISLSGPGSVQLGSNVCPPVCAIDLGAAAGTTLTALPAAASRLVGWAGDCSGMGAEQTIEFASLGRALARCTATFESNTATSTGNLVLNAGFEQIVAAGNLPSLAGAWQGDATNTVLAEGGIAPHGGANMLKFIATGAQASATLVSSQMWQIVDLRAWGTAIDAGGVRLDASAWFNRVTGGPSTDRRFDLRVLAFDTTDAGVPTRYQANAALAVGATSVDTAGAAWQQGRLQLLLPPLTRVVLAEIYAYEDVLNDAQAPEFDGHYADDVVLTLTLP